MSGAPLGQGADDLSISCFDKEEAPRGPGKWNWNFLRFLPETVLLTKSQKDKIVLQEHHGGTINLDILQ